MFLFLFHIFTISNVTICIQQIFAKFMHNTVEYCDCYLLKQANTQNQKITGLRDKTYRTQAICIDIKCITGYETAKVLQQFNVSYELLFSLL